MKYNSNVIPGCTIAFILSLCATGVNAQINSTYNPNGSVKSVEQRRYEESQQKRNAANIKTEPSKSNTGSSSYSNSNIQATPQKTEPIKREYPAAAYRFDKQDVKFYEGLAIVSRKETSYGYPDETYYGFANEQGEVVIPLIYSFVYDFKDGVAKVYGTDPLQSSLINKDGSKVSKGYYRQMAYFKDGMSVVSVNGKDGYINRAGQEVIAPAYDWAQDFSEGFAGVKLNKKWGFINKAGFEIIPFEYDEVKNFSEGLVAVQLNGKWGFIDKTDKKIIPFAYDDAGIFSEGLAAVQLNGKWGFIDKAGKEIIPFAYNWTQVFSEGVASVKSDGKYGYIDKTGKLLIPFTFYDAYPFHNGKANVRTSSNDGANATWIVITNPIPEIPVVNTATVKKETTPVKITAPIKKTVTPVKKAVKKQ